MRPLPSILLLLGLTHPSTSRRSGGGDGGDGGGGEDDPNDGSPDGSGSFGSGIYCPHSRASQQLNILSGPLFSTFYTGQVTLTYTLTSSTFTGILEDLDGKSNITSSPDLYNCIRPDGASHSFTYEAVLEVNSYVSPGNTSKYTDVNWSLRAFQPWGVSYNPATFNPNPPRREVLSLSRYGYPRREVFFENGTRDTTSLNNECWEVTAISPEKNQSNNEIQGVSITSQFIDNPLSPGFEAHPGLPRYPSDNWIPLDDVCANGFMFSKSINMSPIPGRNKGWLSTIFLQPSIANRRNNMTATISGVGSDRATFSIKNGSFERALGGGEAYITCYDEAVFDVPVNNLDPSDQWYPYIFAEGSEFQTWWNASGRFEVSFEGVRNESVSGTFLGVEEEGTFPRFSAVEGSAGVGKVMNWGFLVVGLVMAFVLS